MPTAHAPSGDPQVYRNHFISAIEEWLRTGVISFENLATRLFDEIDHPSDTELAKASEDSQDGSIAYHVNVQDGTVAVAPAIPHTDETRAAAAAAAGGGAAPATTSTATAGGEQLADVSGTPGATPDNPEGSTETATGSVLNTPPDEPEAEPGNEEHSI